jgi:hypothetical protein
MNFGTAIVLVCLAMSGLPVLGQTLPEIARQQGGSAGTVIDITSPVSHSTELMLRSDLVIHGRVLDVKTRLNSAESDVITEYTVAPIQAFKDRRSTSVATPGTVPKIVVERYGGRLVTEDGLRLSTSVNVFPESECFTVGEEVLLFLTYHSDTRVYSFAGGEFGAYRVRDGMVSPMTRRVAARAQAQPIQASVFFKELQKTR